jgi:hypothetical protein
MKKSTRFLLLLAVLLTALAVSAYGVALAAPGLNLASSTLGQLLFAGPTDPVSSGIPSVDAAVSGTETPDATEPPEIETETPEASKTPEPGDDNEVVGVVGAVDGGSITVDGVVYNLADSSEVKGAIQVGDQVKLEFVTNPDGTLIVREVKVANSTSGDQGSSGDPGGHSGNHDGGHDSGGEDHGSDD